MSDHIPVEIITIILNKATDVKDLQRWRLVSKQWLSIIDSDDFIKSHLQRSQVTSSNLGLFIFDKFSDSSFFYSDDIASGRFNFRRHPMLEKHLGSTSSIFLGCCDGLICYWIPSLLSQLFIMNPSTGEGHYVSSINTDGLEFLLAFGFLLSYGFGYDPLSDDYIAVMINPRWLSGALCTSVEIHHIRGRYCRRVDNNNNNNNNDVTFDYIMSILWKCDAKMGVFVCGALHWMPSGMGQLIALDLKSDTFHLLRQPSYNNADGVEKMCTLGVLESRLCIYAMDECLMEVEVWIMGEYGEEGSWYRAYNIQFGWNIFQTSMFPSIIPIGRSRTGQILFPEDDNGIDTCLRLVWFDPLSNMVEEVEIGDYVPGQWRDAFYCLESLVKIFPRDRCLVAERADVLEAEPEVQALLLQSLQRLEV